jgi:hypothetical protein
VREYYVICYAGGQPMGVIEDFGSVHRFLQVCRPTAGVPEQTVALTIFFPEVMPPSSAPTPPNGVEGEAA